MEVGLREETGRQIYRLTGRQTTATDRQTHRQRVYEDETVRQKKPKRYTQADKEQKREGN